MATLYVLIAGSNHAECITFLDALGEPEDAWVDEETGVAYRHITVDESLEVYLFAPPHPLQFNPLPQLNQSEVLGYILLFDCTDRASWPDTRIIAEYCQSYARLPTVLGACGQDKRGAATPEQLSQWYGLDAMTSVRGVIAADPSSARSLFLQLLYSVQQEIERIDKLISDLENWTFDDDANSNSLFG